MAIEVIPEWTVNLEDEYTGSRVKIYELES